ncbi:MAG: TIGR01212 family radical SAM protein [Solobacterium sp.]|nr:TIGR01212 family radical SAM protein [Solobacterium sp.]
MRRLSEVLKEEYGEKVYRLTLSSGCTCPNRDGSLSYGGCTFCSEGGSGEFAADYASVEQQIEEAKKRIAGKTDAKKFIAYFQSFTNTYGDVKRLSDLYEETIRREDIVILSLGTRPDCLGEEVMEMLRNLNRIKPVWVELGLQTIHKKTAERINRQYPLSVFEEAYRKLKAEGITVIVHVIFGLPWESRDDMLKTIQYLSELEPELDGIKIQMLNILRGTKMAEEYLQNPFPLLTLEKYAELVKESIRILPENTVIHRMSGDGPGKLLIGPDWIRNKKRVLNTINREIAKLP